MLSRLSQFVSSLFAGRVHRPLAQMLRRHARDVRGTYDAARTTPEFQNFWANADYLDADAGHNKLVRSTLVARSRYEIQSNGYSDGIAQTWSTDLVGVGPRLRMLSGSTGFNQLVEFEFARWVKAIHFQRKLWCMAHAKHSDGEVFGVIRTNRGVRHPVMLDLVLYETEQCSTPMVPFTELGYIDGIKYDEFGNPEWYDLMRQHPGAMGYAASLDFTPEQVPAKFMLHWYKMRRPGQHRGVPDMSSTLNTGASGRRFREATVTAAETAADISMMLESNYSPERDERDPYIPFDSFPVEKRTAMALPNGLKASQLKAEHPTATYESFHKQLVNEQARPKNMPYNKAACDSSSYNFASGRLDHSTYYGSLDVERVVDLNNIVLDPLFEVWFDEAVRVYRWLGGNPDAISPAARFHQWDWPAHQVADVKGQADANDKRLRNGTLSLSAAYSEVGEDFEDALIVLAADFGLTVDEMRKVLLRTLYPVGALALEPPKSETTNEETDETGDETADETADETDADDDESTELEDETDDADADGGDDENDTADEEDTADAAA